jgi:hypothetical protein
VLDTPGKPFRVSPKVLCPRSSRSARPKVLTGTVVLSRPKGLPVMMISPGRPGAALCAQAFEKDKVTKQAQAKAES